MLAGWQIEDTHGHAAPEPADNEFNHVEAEHDASDASPPASEHDKAASDDTNAGSATVCSIHLPHAQNSCSRAGF